MSRLNGLINELCPNGVEYKALGDIAIDIYRGEGITRNQITEEGMPCVRYGEIYTKYNIWFDECVSYTNENIIANPKYFESGDILFAITGEKVEEIAKSIAYVGNEKCLAGGDIVVLKHNQNPKYLAYALSTTSAQMQKSKGKVKSKVVHSSVPAIQKIRIPIPPLQVQEEIVHILDSFTELEKGLEKELEKRKKQYEYYRDYVVPYEEDVEWMSISEAILSLKTGLNPRNNFKLNVDGADCYYVTGKDVFDNNINISDRTDKITQETVNLINKRACLHDNVLMFVSTGTGTVGRMTVIDHYTGDWNVSETMYIITVDDNKILSRYLLHLLYSSVAKIQFEPKITKGSVPHLKVADLLAVKIPVPSLNEQEHIVNLLDHFDALCTDISSGIPAEIESRRKQYEYYRDKLLTFKGVNEKK